ncbi:site-2 protease family protein [Pedococcus sp. P5_B7]
MTTRAPEQQPEESGHGVRIARVGGVPVYLAPSWFLIAAVIVAIVATPYFPDRVGTGIAIGVTQALLLLVSVLVHEAAHAVTARVFKMPVIRIVANLWGGHTSFEAARSTPGRLAAIAAAGPASNAVLAVVAWLLLLTTSGDRMSTLLTGLVIINGSLAVLNFLPGMPLDGGQVVESLVWKATGNRNKGSVVAGWCGRVLTVLLVLWFFVRPLAQGEQIGLDSIWVLVIGSVLWSGATQSIRRGQALSQWEALHVAQVMEPAVFLDPRTPLRVAIAHPDAVVTTDARGIPCLFLASPDGGTPPGLDPEAPLSSAVVRIPDDNVLEVSPDANALAVVEVMQSTGHQDVVLTWHGRVYGIAHARLVNEAAARN